MDVGAVSEISREAVYTLVMVSSPILFVALIVGLMISLFQALTQIQETTLTFVPKIIAVYFSMIVILPFMYAKLTIFMDHIIQRIIGWALLREKGLSYLPSTYIKRNRNSHTTSTKCQYQAANSNPRWPPFIKSPL